MGVRSILLVAVLLLASPASALAAGRLDVAIAGAGRVSGTGIDCTRSPGVTLSGTCSLEIASTQAAITAEPGQGFAFVGWGGDCAGSGGPLCTLDMASNRATDATFRDVQPPVVSLDPSLAGTKAGPLPIAATVTDNGLIDRVEFKVRNGKAVDDDAPYAVTFPTATVPDGPATISVTAYDRADNARTESADVVFDNTAPVLSVSGPDREPFAPGSTQTWAFGASDAGSAISGYRCSVVPFGEAPVMGLCSGTGTHSVSGLPDGRYTFTVRARDAVGNIGEEVRFFRIETPVAVPAAPPAAAAGAAAPSATPAPPRIAIALGFSFVSAQRATKLTNVVVKGVPAGAAITVRCAKGCRQKVLRRFVKAGGRVVLKRLALRPLKVGSTITIIVSKAGFTSAVKVLTIRARMAPVVTTQCQPEGASKPVGC